MTSMTRKRKWIGGSLLTLMLALAVGGWWLWQSFVWVFFVKPGDGGRQWSLPITAVTGDPGGQSGFRDGGGRGGAAGQTDSARLVR